MSVALPLLVSVLIAVTSTTAQDFFAQGNTLYSQGHFPEARASYERAKSQVQGESKRADVLSNLASLLSDMGLTEESEREYRVSLRLNASHGSALFNLAMLLQDQRRFRESQELYERLVSLDDTDADVWANLGAVYHESGMLSSAVDAYKRSVSLTVGTSRGEDSGPEARPMLANLYENIGRAYTRLADQVSCRQGDDGHQGDEDTLRRQAVQAFNNALVHEPGRAVATHMLAALTGASSDTAPATYVRDLFDDYSKNFDESLAALDYRVPDLIADEIKRLSRHLTLHQTTQANSKDGRASSAVHTRTEKVYDVCLDIGCGTGLLANDLAAASDVLVGVDLSAGMLASAVR
jgi:predicted TPR repeat methyltransferase